MIGIIVDCCLNDWGLFHANLLICLLWLVLHGFLFLFFPSAIVNLHQQLQINPLRYLFFSSSFDLDYDFQRDYYDRYVKGVLSFLVKSYLFSKKHLFFCFVMNVLFYSNEQRTCCQSHSPPLINKMKNTFL